jgi:hypothetical protein
MVIIQFFDNLAGTQKNVDTDIDNLCGPQKIAKTITYLAVITIKQRTRQHSFKSNGVIHHTQFLDLDTEILGWKVPR